jgi:tripartite-type tricarboxylate transporter receptor subunit TctC
MNMYRPGTLLATSVLVLAASLIGTASAQSFPAKPMRIFTVEAGGALDITVRSMAQVMAPALGQPIVIENRPSQTHPQEAVLKGTPDGHVLLYWANPLWITPFLRNVNYDPVRDFAPITLAAKAPSAVVVPASLSARTVGEFVQMAKAAPGTLNFASTTAGSTPHLAAVLFATQAGIDLTQITYKGTVQGVNDLMAARVHIMFPSIAAVISNVRAGKLRALAVTSTEASGLLPGVPTVAASGYPDYEAVSSHALFAPAGTPTAVIQKIHQEAVHALQRADVKDKLFQIGVDVAGSSPEQLAATMKSEMARMGKLIRDKGIRAEN